MVNKVLVRHRINHQRYDVLICRIVKVSALPLCLGSSALSPLGIPVLLAEERVWLFRSGELP